MELLILIMKLNSRVSIICEINLRELQFPTEINKQF